MPDSFRVLNRRRGLEPGSAGFTLVETMVSAALVGLAALSMMAVFGQVSQETSSAGRRNNHTVMRMQARSLLEDPGTCLRRLSPTGAPVALSLDPTANRWVASLDWIGPTPDVRLVGKGPPIEGVRYTLALDAGPTPLATYPAGTAGRAREILRYQGALVLTGVADGKASQMEARIPISLEAGSADKTLVGCTTSPARIEESLFWEPNPGNSARHTVRDCEALHGVPFPTRKGLICRVPNMNPKYEANVSCPANWADSGFKSLEGTFYPGKRCKSCKLLGGARIKDAADCNSPARYFSDARAPGPVAKIEGTGEEIEGCEWRHVKQLNLNLKAGLGVAGLSSNLGVDPVTSIVAGLGAALFGCNPCDGQTDLMPSKVIARGCF